MKLTNLEISSTMRLTQPNVGDELQTLDIEFDLTKGAVIDNDLYSLAFYGMLNGYVDGKDDGPVVTGIKISAYDQTNVLVAESVPSKIDMVVDEMYTRLEAKSTTLINDTSTDVYISKIAISYVANDEGVAKESLIFTSPAPATCVFAEVIGVTTKKGILLEAGNETSMFGKFALFFRT